MAGNPVSIFISYSRKDEAQMRELERHLQPLKRSQLVESWHDGYLIPGDEWEPQIKAQLEQAQIILLLISVDFINSDYCYNIELRKAIARHKAKDACVIPVILRDCMWEDMTISDMCLGELQALPKDAKPVGNWENPDKAFANVARGIRKRIQQLKQDQEQGTAEAQHQDELRSEKGIDYTHLRDLLKAKDWKAADAEIYEVMIQAVGKQSGDWCTVDELLNFPCIDLHTIDKLWIKYSQGKFGFSVQKKIYIDCGAKLDGKYPGDEIWNKFCGLVDWRRGGTGIHYDDVIFATSAIRGHLPVIAPRLLFIRFWDGVGGFGGIFSRIETCEV